MLTLRSTGGLEGDCSLGTWECVLIECDIADPNCELPQSVSDESKFDRLSFSKSANPVSFALSTMSRDTTTFCLEVSQS